MTHEIITDIGNNRCEICNQLATNALLENTTNDEEEDDNIGGGGNIRFSCNDHYMALHDKIAKEGKEKRMINNNSDSKE